MENQGYAFIGGKVFDGKTLENSTLLVQGNKITNLMPQEATPKKFASNIKVISVADCIISAGFIDLQLNGCGGVLFNDAITESTLNTMYKTVLQFGCTSFLPTLVTTSWQDMVKAVEVATNFYKKILIKYWVYT